MALREEKRDRLRSGLIATAQRLFAAKGYEATTLEEISREHHVHSRTLLRYFGTKEDLALAPARDGFEAFSDMLAQARGRAGVIVCWRDYVQNYWFGPPEDAGRAFGYLQLLTSTTSLRALVVDLDRRFEEVIACALAREEGVDETTDVYAQILATNLVSAPRNVAFRQMPKGDLAAVVSRLVAVIDLVAANFPDRAQMMRGWP